MLASRIRTTGTRLCYNSANYVCASRFSTWQFISDFFLKNAVVYPELQLGIHQTTRIFPTAIKNGLDELNTYLLALGEIPLILQFTIRGNAKYNPITKEVYRILNFDVTKKINLVDVDIDEPKNDDVLLTYGIKDIPTLVCVEKELIKSKFVPNSGEDFNKSNLKDWINSMAI